MSKRLGVTAGAGFGLGAALAVPATAQAEDIRVTNLNSSGAGSLRQAVLDAADPGSDRILFRSKLSGSIELGGDELRLCGGDVEIAGPGARRVTVDAEGSSRAFLLYGGLIQCAASDTVISGLSITGGDTVGRGGGIYAYGPDLDLTLSRVTVADNSSGDDGGGVAISLGNDDRFVIADSTVSGNTAEGDGGGIFITGADGSIRNSTISGNSALYEPGIHGGGGIWVDTEPLTIESSTIADNDAEFGGGIFTSRADVTLDGTVVADNTAEDGADTFVDYGAFASFTASYTLIEDDAGFPVGGSNSIFGVDPKLKPLANNGGPTDTHAFKKSKAKNKIPKGQTPKSDQRGAPRKGKGDIGAYELAKCEGVVVNRVGTAKKDKLKGTKKKDGILGLGGNDKLSGKKGVDGLCGGKGKDKLKGGPGVDKLDGGPGKDKEIQ